MPLKLPRACPHNNYNNDHYSNHSQSGTSSGDHNKHDTKKNTDERTLWEIARDEEMSQQVQKHNVSTAQPDYPALTFKSDTLFFLSFFVLETLQRGVLAGHTQEKNKKAEGTVYCKQLLSGVSSIHVSTLFSHIYILPSVKCSISLHFGGFGVWVYSQTPIIVQFLWRILSVWNEKNIFEQHKVAKRHC